MADPSAARRPHLPLSGVSDVLLRSILRVVDERLGTLEGHPNVIPKWEASVDANGFQLRNLADPTKDTDAANRRWSEQDLPRVIQLALESNGRYPLDVTGLRGILADAQPMRLQVIPDAEPLPPTDPAPDYVVIFWRGSLYYLEPTVVPPAWRVVTTAGSILSGTHAEKLAEWGTTPDFLPLGTMFWETDRYAMHYVITSLGTKRWGLLFARMRDDVANIPGDLSPFDDGFVFDAADEGVRYRWDANDTTATPSGTWHLWEGVLVRTGLPGGAVTEPADRGMEYVADDLGGHRWRWDGSDWVLVGAGLYLGTLDPDQKPGLGSPDAGFLFGSTDFNRVYRWNGTAWEDAPGAPTRFQIVFFADTPDPAAGWGLCDGGTVARSQSDGTTTALVTVDLQSDGLFLRSAGSFGATGGGEQTGPPDDVVWVTAGADIDVASDAHVHDAMPPFVEAVPYVRL